MLGASGGVLGSSGESGGAGGVSNMEVVVGGGGGGGGGGGDGSNSGLFGDEDKGRIMEDGGDRSSGGGNRWPRQETIALLKIRSEMDVVFRDSSLKGPLWEDVSRKMADLGYHRSAKKCKEKFENVYKYHKRTKDGRSTKQDGKTYRFFDQLEALENHPPSLSLPQALPPPPLPPPPPQQTSQPSQTPPPPPAVIVATTMPMNLLHAPPHHVTVTSTTNPIISNVQQPPQPSSIPNTHMNLVSNSTSSSTSSDEEFQEGRIGRKRKWKDFFERLMKEVIHKQEELQKKFLDAIEKREHDRTVREEAWRMQEMARMNREHEVLVQERSVAAAKDTAVIAFLQKISEQQPPLQQTQHTQTQQNPVPVVQPQPQQQQQQLSIDYNSPVAATHQQSQPQSKVTQKQPKPTTATPPPPPLPLPPPSSSTKLDNGGDSIFVSPGASSSRWPKTEVQALINLRTTLDMKYQENGPKGPLWEDISAGMQKLGYNRNAKRCKEKWENINKYFKKVKESNKRRPEDSKTCPYFHLLDAIYKERSKADLSSSSSFNQTPMAPLMVQPEQQWAPIQQDHQQQQQQQQRQNQQQQETVMDDVDDEEEDEDDGDEDDNDDEEDEGGGGYEIVSNKLPAKTVGNVE